MSRSFLLFVFLILSSQFVVAQSLDSELLQLEQELGTIKAQEQNILKQIELVKFDRILRDLHEVGLPIKRGEELIKHHAMCLVYSEEHEQAKWVAHIITPDILEGQVTRTNDFRIDTKVKTGTAVEQDYFLKYRQADGSYEYDGFGYDRGHLAPSADFRWSKIALSESYLYSNMSPQHPDFNRDGWAELENVLRSYIYRNPTTQLYVMTGGILEDDLPVIERGVNQVSIPKRFWKVALDLTNQKAIGFIMPNQKLNYPLESFAVSVDQIEQETGLNFFQRLDDELENQLETQRNTKDWIPQIAAGDVEPIYPTSLSFNEVNTVQARSFIDKQIKVCGTVVSARTSRSDNILINLDKRFPNQIFTVFIPKENIINFPYQPEKELLNMKVCVKGRIFKMGSTSAMKVTDDKKVKFLSE